MSFIVKLDTYDDYRNYFGSTDFSPKGFELLCDYCEDLDFNLDEIGKLENYYSEYSSLIEAAERYIDEKYIKDYKDPDSEHFEEEEWLLEGFRDCDVEVMYDYASGVTVVDER